VRYLATPAEHTLPRYVELVAKHGAPPVAGAAAGAAGDEGPAADMAELTLTSSRGQSVRKRLPLGLEVGRLRVLVQRQFRLPPGFTLSVRLNKASLPVALDDDMRALAFYGCADGTEVLAE
jgi:hypothetical protein